jgi:hypothetical protein
MTKHLSGLKAFGSLSLAAILMVGGALVASFLADNSFAGW